MREYHIKFAHPSLWDRAWCAFLPAGLINTPLATHEMTKDSAYAVGNSVLRIDIEHLPTKRKRIAWYDLGDFVRDSYDAVMKSDDTHYFKIQALKENMGAKRNFHPMPQYKDVLQ